MELGCQDGGMEERGFRGSSGLSVDHDPLLRHNHGLHDASVMFQLWEGDSVDDDAIHSPLGLIFVEYWPSLPSLHIIEPYSWTGEWSKEEKKREKGGTQE